MAGKMGTNNVASKSAFFGYCRLVLTSDASLRRSISVTARPMPLAPPEMMLLAYGSKPVGKVNYLSGRLSGLCKPFELVWPFLAGSSIQNVIEFCNNVGFRSRPRYLFWMFSKALET